MRKIFLTTIGLFIFVIVLLSLPTIVAAATLTFDNDTTIALPNGINLTVLAGSLVESLVINDDSTISVTVGADTNLTTRSNDVYTLNGPGTISCSAGNYNQLTTTNSSGNGTISVSQTLACQQNAGGGGGGGGATPAAPTATSVSINSGASETSSVNVTLTLAATNASSMLISNKADFSDTTSWENYAASKTWTLLAGVGTKTVYAKFRSSAGGVSSVVSDTIALVEVAQPASGAVSNSAGGSVSSSDDKASVSLPAGAISGSGTVTITPTTSYTAPSGKKVVGSEVYDFSLTVSGAVVATFSKPVTLTFTYSDSDIVGITESTLAVYYFDETASQWVKLGGTINAANNSITVQTTHFTEFAVIGEPTVGSGQLIKLACAANADVNDPCKAVYYLGNNGKRYVFPNEKTYKTWYNDFSTVETVSAAEMASHMIGGNVTYRPGVKLVKIQTNPKVYAVSANGTLRWVKTAVVAESLYGSAWSSMIEDIPDPFFINYKEGQDIESASSYDKAVISNAAVSINVDKGL